MVKGWMTRGADWDKAHCTNPLIPRTQAASYSGVEAVKETQDKVIAFASRHFSGGSVPLEINIDKIPEELKVDEENPRAWSPLPLWKHFKPIFYSHPLATFSWQWLTSTPPL
jgi:hypothetical protein